MKIDAYLTPLFPERESQFKNAVVVMLDVLRSSTTICAALFSGAKEIIPCDSFDKAARIFNGLSHDVRFLGGERNGIKPNGFDAGNSPFEYTHDKVKGKIIILTTTNGTKTFLKAKEAKYRIIAGFVNFSAVIGFLSNIITDENLQPRELTFICAGNDGKLSIEDTLCAGAFIEEITKRIDSAELTDSALAARDLFRLHQSNIVEFLKSGEHARKLQNLGFGDDLDISFSVDAFNVLPSIINNNIRILENY